MLRESQKLALRIERVSKAERDSCENSILPWRKMQSDMEEVTTADLNKRMGLIADDGEIADGLSRMSECRGDDR
jgi:hypothetical protein